MKLFDVMPERFFILLASPNRKVYAEAVLLLYEHYLANQFGIPYDVLRDALQELLETTAPAGLTLDQLDDDSAAWPEGHSDMDIFRARAGTLLRQLKLYGWIDIEDRANYQRFVVLPRYSSRILEVLKELCNQRAVEYQRFAFVTYTLLTNKTDRPGYAILEAEDTTRKFINALRELTHNMRSHMDEVVKKNSIEEVLDYHFDEYKAKVVDRSYHRLKTSDHVSRYRLKILETVQNYLIDPASLLELVRSATHEDFAENKAEEQIRSALLYIEEAYRNLDDTLYQIDLRHHQYIRASFDRARYLGQYSQGLDKRLGQILEWVARHPSADTAEAFSLFGVAQLTNSSLLPPRKKRPPLDPQTPVEFVIPAQLRQQQRELNLTRLSNAITPAKVANFILARMGDRELISMADLAPSSTEDFVHMAFAYLYGNDGKSGYKIRRSPDAPLTRHGPYTFTNHKLIRTPPKGGNAHVRRT